MGMLKKIIQQIKKNSKKNRKEQQGEVIMMMVEDFKKRLYWSDVAVRTDGTCSKCGIIVRRRDGIPEPHILCNFADGRISCGICLQNVAFLHQTIDAAEYHRELIEKAIKENYYN